MNIKKVFILVAVIALVLGFYFYAKYKLHIDERAIITSLKPPAGDNAKKLPQGSDLSYPLTLPQGFRIGVFADLKGALPRVLAFDPNGILVTSIPKQGRIVAFPDENEDGVADKEVDILKGLDRPHGIAFSGSYIYIAETDRVIRYQYDKAKLAAIKQEVLFSLPGGGNHFTRTIKILGDKLYTSIGSSCDVCVEKDKKRATLLVSDLDGKNLKVFAKGLRNTVFFVGDEKGRIWGTDMGRDYLGDNLPPDEINIIEEGKDYGWPYCYGKNVHDRKFDKTLYDLLPGANVCESLGKSAAIFDLPAHVAPLGLAFDSKGDLLVAFHGSWNSSVPVGYKIVKLDVSDGKVTKMEDFITGFITDDREVLGRPVDLVFDANGTLYISDDKAGLIYILTR